MSRPARALVDANVFVATWTLDVILTMADEGLVAPFWSDGVLDEAREAVCRVRKTAAASRYVDAAAKAFPFSTVYPEEGALEGIVLPDPGDRHVVAAAVEGRCDAVVTYNLRDFPDGALAPLGIRALHPDDFLMEVAEGSPEAAMAAVRSLVAAKRHPPRSIAEEVSGLRANRLAKFADLVERMA